MRHQWSKHEEQAINNIIALQIIYELSMNSLKQSLNRRTERAIQCKIQQVKREQGLTD